MPGCPLHCTPHNAHPVLAVSACCLSSFQFTYRIGPILLPSLSVVTVPQYLALCVAAALLCLLKEYLYGYRMHLSRAARTRRKQPAASSSSPTAAADDDGGHTADTEHSLPLMSPAHARALLSPSPGGSSLLAAYSPSLLYAANTLLAYCVMLLVMSYNAGLIAVIVVASAVGHHYFTRTEEADDSRRSRGRDSREGRARSGSRGKKQQQQLVGRRGQTEKGSERVELAVDDDPQNEEDWLGKDCCEQ